MKFTNNFIQGAENSVAATSGSKEDTSEVEDDIWKTKIK
jgi:hypothetical protein